VRRLVAGVVLLVACGAAVGADVRRVTPDGEKPVRETRYAARDGTYRMPFPALGTPVYVRDTMVNEHTGWAEFTSRDGLSLYVVSMRLDSGPRDARELDAVKRRYADFSRQLGDRFRERAAPAGRFGPSYGFTLLNADPVTGYPVNIGYRPAASIESAAVHRFFVHGGVLYELAALVQRQGATANADAAQLAARGEALVEAALASFEPIQKKSPTTPEKR
jgi:hypothetical protein